MSSSAEFNESYYLTNNADVVLAMSQGHFSSALHHFNSFGGKELRAPNATFNATYYATQNPDVLNAVAAGVFSSVFAHFQAFGETENRAPNSTLASFDAEGYLAANADVADAVTAGTFKSALDHYLSFGQNETRSGSGIAAGTQAGQVGSNFALTASTDTITGTANNDTIIGSYDTTPSATFSIGDVIDGGAGIDTLTITKTAAIAQGDVAPTGATVTNVETVTITTGAQVVANTSTGALTGITTLNTTGTGGATVTAAATTDINLTDLSIDATTDGEVTINGGKDVTATLRVDDATTDGDGTAEIAIGGTTAAAGAVDVTYTSRYADGANNSASNIAVTGGTAVTVTVNAGVTAAQETAALTDNTNFTITQSAVAVTGNASTTSVNVQQTNRQTEVDATDGSGRVGITGGAVTVADANAASGTAAGTITTVSLSAFGNSTIDSSALTTVNLSGTGNGTLGIGRGALTATPTANTLTINANAATTGAITDSEAAADDGFTTIVLNGTGGASTLAGLTAADATTITATGDSKITLTTHTLAALTTVDSSGNSGGLDMDGTALGNSVTFTGGAGADAAQFGATTQANTLGAGNDTVVYGAAAGTGGSVAAGDGTDIVQMTFALANAADASATFNSTYSGFETLQLTNAVTGALDMDALNNVSRVILDADPNGGAINNIDSGGTVVQKANAGGGWAIGVDGAVVSNSDSITLKMEKTGVLVGNTVTISNVETINLDLSDPSTAGAAAIHTLTLTADRATSVVVTGNNGLNVTATGSTRVTNFDASAIASNNTTAVAGTAGTTDTAANLAVTYTSLNTTSGAAVSIAGGAGNDTLTAGSGNTADTISGNAGADTIQGGRGADVLDGGAGTDILTYADVTTATSHALTNVSGMAINLSDADIAANVVATAMTGTVVLGGGNASAGTALAAGSVGYMATTAANSTTTMVRDTVSNFETLIGSTLADYIAGSSGNETIRGGDGADYILGDPANTSGRDTIQYNASSDGGAADATNADNATSVVGADTIIGFAAGSTGDTLSFLGSVFGSTGANATAVDFDNIAGAANGGTRTGFTDVTANTVLPVIVHQTDLTNHAALEALMDTTINGGITNTSADQAIVIVGIDTVDTALGSENALVIFDPNLGTNADHLILGNLGAIDLTTLTADNFSVY